jgi:hypothetical protein
MDRLFERPLVEAACAMDLEIPPLLQARATEIPFSISSRYGKTAARAYGGAYGPDCRTTIGTYDEILFFFIEACLTDGAHRREDEIHNPPEGAGEPHLKIPVRHLRGM